MNHRSLRPEIDSILLGGESDDEYNKSNPPLPESHPVSDSQVESRVRTRRGLDNDVKRKLLLSLDKHGGIEALSYSNRVLATICDANPEEFGSPNGVTPRKRRKQCQNFIQKMREMDPPRMNAMICNIISNRNVPLPSKQKNTTSSPRQQRRKVVAKRTQPSAPMPATKTKAASTAKDLSSLVLPIKPIPATSASIMSTPTRTPNGIRNQYAFNLDGSRPIPVDITRPENHFPLKVFPFTNAPVNDGKHMVSGFDIQYKALIADVNNDRVKATIGGSNLNIVKVELPLLNHIELMEYEALVDARKKLKVHNEVIQDQEQTAMNEILENEERINHSFYMDFGSELVTECMIADGSSATIGEEIDYMVVPLDGNQKIGNKSFKHHIVEVTWRVGFVSTLRKKTKSTKKKGKGSAKVADLISGLSGMNIG